MVKSPRAAIGWRDPQILATHPLRQRALIEARQRLRLIPAYAWVENLVTKLMRSWRKPVGDSMLGRASRDGQSAMWGNLLRLPFVAALCAGLNGCAILDAPMLERSLYLAMTRAELERCAAFQGKGIDVTEATETETPTNEGEVQAFGPAHWHAEFERDDVHTFGFAVWYTTRRESGTQSDRVGTPTEGTLAVTDRSVVLVPTSGSIGVRIPYEVLLKVDISPANPHEVIVNSCRGRYDIFTLRQRHAVGFDPEAATAAAARIKVRAAAFHAAADKAAQSLKW